MVGMLFFLLLQAPPAVPASSAGIWPGEEWDSASPESQGMSTSRLQAAADYARAHGGGSGCMIRHGYLVYEWGSPEVRADIKSATKGSVGTTLLGLAVDQGRVSLEDRALRYYPQMGAETAGNVETGWLGEITVRQLATMTAGFDDGRPPRLVYRPGTSGLYSNDTSNILAELLTLRFGEDLEEVLRRQVLDPIGVSPQSWRWRENAYRPRTVGNLPSREFASGITITHRVLARIGYLYLRNGMWQERRILSSSFIKTATRPTDLPAPWDYYGFYWGTNGRGNYPQIPRDTYWALGLGDSFLLVCPSLDLVVVRLGVGSRQSQLPGGEDWEENWGGRVARFFRMVVEAVEDPYPRSPVIQGVRWASATEIGRAAPGSDNWPLTWGHDDHLYTAYGDGWGFEPRVPEKLSLGLARVAGFPPRFRGANLRSESIEQKGEGSRGRKASGILMVDGVLYLWIRNAGNSQLAWSEDGGAHWRWAEWKFTPSFGAPTFLNFGKNYAGSRDDFVYVYSHDSDSAYQPSDRMVLARVPRQQIRDRKGYQLFRHLDERGEPVWTERIEERGAVFEHPGACYRSSVSYNPGLKRYLWCQTLPGEDPRFAGGFGIYDAPEPWGPWTTVHFTREWDVGPGETSSIPTKWIAAQGRTAHLVFSGEDSFSVRRLEFVIRELP